MDRPKGREADAKERATRRQEVEEVVVRKHIPLKAFKGFPKLFFKAILVRKSGQNLVTPCRKGPERDLRPTRVDLRHWEAVRLTSVW